MPQIQIQQVGYLPNARFTVSVADESGTTTHVVSVNQASYDMLTGGNASAENLVQKAFEYLLERESNNQIKAVFDILEIQRYFGDFVATMKIHFGV